MTKSTAWYWICEKKNAKFSLCICAGWSVFPGHISNINSKVFVKKNIDGCKESCGWIDLKSGPFKAYLPELILMCWFIFPFICCARKVLVQVPSLIRLCFAVLSAANNWKLHQADNKDFLRVILGTYFHRFLFLLRCYFVLIRNANRRVLLCFITEFQGLKSSK